MGTRKIKPVASHRKRAWVETERIFKPLAYSTVRGEDGHDRVRKIFDRTVGQYLDNNANLGRQRWGGALQRWVLSCMKNIAKELNEIASASGADYAGAPPLLVKKVSVKWMRKYKKRSVVCTEPQAHKVSDRRDPSALHGAVCDPYLDSL